MVRRTGRGYCSYRLLAMAPLPEMAGRIECMTTLTIHVDSAIADRAQDVALRRHTTLDQLVQDFLDKLAQTGEEKRAEHAQKLLARSSWTT